MEDKVIGIGYKFEKTLPSGRRVEVIENEVGRVVGYINLEPPIVIELTNKSAEICLQKKKD